MAGDCFAVVDLADAGAVGMCWTSVATSNATKEQRDGGNAEYVWSRHRSLINEPDALTLIYPDVNDATGRSFRTGLGVGHVLGDRESKQPECLPGSRDSTEEHDCLLGNAIGQLSSQITRQRRSNVGVIAADRPYITPSDRLIQQARRAYRADVTLIPWSVAAAACWRDHYRVDREAIAAGKQSVACVLWRYGRVQAARVHLIWDDTHQRVVPLRDYESDVLEDISLSNATALARVEEWLRSQGDYAGVVVIGPSGMEMETVLASVTGGQNPSHVGNLTLNHSALACGAGALMMSVVANGVPYYASAPKVELCGSVRSCKLATLGRPQVTRVSYWFDCLRGAASVVDGHRVFPANQLIKWMSTGTDVLGGDTVIECGRRQVLHVRLYGVEVRSMEVEIGGVLGESRRCRFGCSYVVGSGRPTVYVEVPELGRRFVLEWERLEPGDAGIAVDLEHLHSDDEVRSEFLCREYYYDWYRRYHSQAGMAVSRDPGAPPAAPEGFHDWRRRVASLAPNPCGCGWCNS